MLIQILKSALYKLKILSKNLGGPFILIILASSLLLTSCLSPKFRRKAFKGSLGLEKTNPNGNGSTSDDGRLAQDGDATEEDQLESIEPTSEILWLIDPFTGSYKSKINLPKNYNGFLYVAGLNITSLSDRIVSVRFRFGRELEPVTIQATVARASGITPQTDIQVLVLDLRERPFEQMRLLYDLFDYNEYSADDEPIYSLFEEDFDPSVGPMPDDRAGNLYCRGLLLEHDNTFAGGASDNLCDSQGEKCLYTFAKIKDNGLYLGDLATVPTRPLIDEGDGDFSTSQTGDSLTARNTEILKKCLPDNGEIFYKNDIATTEMQITYDPNDTLAIPVTNPASNPFVLTLGTGAAQSIYQYRGPYRLLSEDRWIIGEQAAIGKWGVFGTSADVQGNLNVGLQSLLFPRAGRLNIDKGVEHVGSDRAFVASSGTSTTPPLTERREVTKLDVAGKSKWMDGCNIRAAYYDKVNGEGIGSCNVSAKIEIITKNTETNTDVVITSTHQVKLQLTRPSSFDFAGRQSLYQSMRTCSNDRGCASDECCFNNRCWSKELVSKCGGDALVEGNRIIGESCASNYQCSSLCCNTSIGRCAVHNSLLETPVYCSKPPGDLCVAREWCRRDNIRDCRIISTGTKPDGTPTCTLRCYNSLTFGRCLNGVCIAPDAPAIPVFDPNNPDCSLAQPPPATLPSAGAGSGGVSPSSSTGNSAAGGSNVGSI